MAECFLEMLRRCSVGQVCQEVNCKAVKAVELCDGNFWWTLEAETLCMWDGDCLECLTVPTSVAVIWSMNLVAQPGAFRLAAAWQFICSHCLYLAPLLKESNWQVWNLLKCYQRAQIATVDVSSSSTGCVSVSLQS